MITDISDRGNATRTILDAARHLWMLQKRLQELGSFRGQAILRRDQWRVLAADVESTSQVTPAELWWQAQPFCNEGVIPWCLLLSCLACNGLLLPLNEECRFSVIALRNGFDQLKIRLGIATALEQEHLCQF